MEHGERITQVFIAVTILQSIEYLLEQVDSCTDTWMWFGLDIHWTACFLSVKRSKDTFEVYPVNSPWRRFIRSIGMRNSRRKDKILIGGNGIFLFTYPIPTGPVDTINEYILIDRFFSFPEVMFGLRIISYIRDMEHGGQRIFLQFVNNHSGKH